MFKLNNIFKSAKESQTKLSTSVCDSLTICFGKSITGDITLNSDCILEGDFSGKMVTTGKIVITKLGKFKGTIYAENIIIEGSFEGTIICKSNLLVKTDAQVLGKLSSHTFEFEENVNFDGELNQINIDEYDKCVTVVDTQKLKTNFESNISENKIENYSVKAPILVKENFKPDSKIRVENLPALKKAKKIDANNLNYKNPENNKIEPIYRQSWF